ncbi:MULTISPECIES: hypothetical protein [Burkholderia]|uniref:hypothetical protein n=1 Tax=Burkholderia TaxID=32008 RepID=UPI0015818590|nr:MULTISPECIES: hypothetical protein [Burkholderia]
MLLSKVAHPWKRADGTTASGVTDDAGKTGRVASVSPLAILSALLTPPPVEVKIMGGQTSQFQ